jgi:hypothetical protein
VYCFVQQKSPITSSSRNYLEKMKHVRCELGRKEFGEEKNQRDMDVDKNANHNRLTLA